MSSRGSDHRMEPSTRTKRPSSTQAIMPSENDSDEDERILSAWTTAPLEASEQHLTGSSPPNRPAAPPLWKSSRKPKGASERRRSASREL
jgi:hypothetical protein